jgi:integrase
VFPSTGKTGHLTTIMTFWRSVVKGKAGMEDVVLYDLRRSFITRMMENGADIATVMAASGHTTPGVLLKHYVKAVEGKQRAAIEGLFS